MLKQGCGLCGDSIFPTTLAECTLKVFELEMFAKSAKLINVVIVSQDGEKLDMKLFFRVFSHLSS